MRKLRLVGLSADGQQVVFVDDAGSEFAAPADDRLRAALRGDRARLGQLEIEMDSALRPRDIQARIRAGETPEASQRSPRSRSTRSCRTASPCWPSASTSPSWPVAAIVRRKNAEGPARALTDVVAERLREPRARPRRRPSGTPGAATTAAGRAGARYQSGERERAATFVFDAVGRYSIADDDEAKWLTGEKQATSKGPQPRETARPATAGWRPSPTPSVAADAGEMESDDLLSLAEDSDDLTAVVRAVNRADTAEEVAEDLSPATETDDGRPTRPPTRCSMRRSRPSSRPSRSLTPPRTRRRSTVGSARAGDRADAGAQAARRPSRERPELGRDHARQAQGRLRDRQTRLQKSGRGPFLPSSFQAVTAAFMSA